MNRRQELEQLASEKPQELALIFAQKVAGFPDAEWYQENNPLTGKPNIDAEWFMRSLGKMPGWLPDYLTDWTAVINAGKKAGIRWQKIGLHNYQDIVYQAEMNACEQSPDWPDCAALMIVMIEVVEKTTRVD